MIVRANRIIQTLIVVFVLLTTPPAFAGNTSDVDKDTKHSEKHHDYAPEGIIIKFKEPAASTIGENTFDDPDVTQLDWPDSLAKLNKKFQLSGVERLFKNFKVRKERTEALLKKDKSLLTKREKHILQRLKRAPKKATVPALDRIYKLRIELEAGQSIQGAVAAYNNNPEVEYAELNYIVSIDQTPDDPLYPLQWSLNNTGQIYPESGHYNPPPGTHDCDIDAPEAWDIYTGSPEIIVAVVDTGVDYRHRDLDDNMWINIGEIAGNGIDDDGNGYVDDIYGYDFINNDGDPCDDSGHGTHCAGTIAAEGDNGLDITGVCFRARIMALKFLGSGGSGKTSDAVTALYYAVGNGADVTSNSWGGGSYSNAMKDAIDYAHSQGVIMVASAGNKNWDRPQYPAYYDHMISVAAMNSNDEQAPFSNYGEWVDIAAPGVDILSLRAENTSKGTVYDDYTTILSGTSMACPHVAGACALLLSVNPHLTCGDVNDILKRTVDPIVPEICQSGRLNLVTAMPAVVSPKGSIILERDYYSCADMVGIFLADIDLRGNNTQQVLLSTSGGDLETVLLTKTPPNIGIFTGTISTVSAPPNLEDNTLQLSHGEIINVAYEDTNDGSGNPAIVEDSALADCVSPAIFNVRVERTSSVGASITFETDEPTKGRIQYDLACGEPYTYLWQDPALATVHAFKISDLSRETSYYFIAQATDLAGNQTTSKNGGLCYSFTTGESLEVNVPGDFPTIQAAIDAVWEGDVVIVADGTYTGPGNCDLDFHGQAITVRSQNGPENCIIDCNGTQEQPYRGFYFHHGEGPNSVVRGFTITNGYALADGGGAIICIYSSPTIENCIFSRNSAVRAGGGMLTYYSSAILTGCTFKENMALIDDYYDYSWGGGMYSSISSPILVDCAFSHNAAQSGGAVYFWDCWSPGPVLTGCTFSGNSAGYDGGGVYSMESNVVLTQSTFRNNSAQWWGGAFYNYDGDLDMANCTVSENSAQRSGGGICGEGTFYIDNTILWGNTDLHTSGEWAQIRISDPVYINYSCVQGWSGVFGGVGNTGADPLLDDELRLLPQSSCLDAGDNDAVPPDTFDLDGDGNTVEPIPIDLDGGDRFTDHPGTPDTGNPGALGGPIVDIGAYEGAGQGFLLNTRLVIVPEQGTKTFTVALAQNPLQTVAVIVERSSGDIDITVASGASLTFDSSNYSAPQSVVLKAAEDIDNLDGSARFEITAPGFGTAVVRATEADNDPPAPVLYVDAKAPGINNGASWAQAYTELRDALKIAAGYPGVVKEIRVAQGVYTPGPVGESAATFQLTSGVAVYGGYAGLRHQKPDARDIQHYETILSGDLRGDDNDVNNPLYLIENSYSVITGSGTDTTAVLDGLTVTGGRGSYGGGMYNENGNPTINRCTFRGNTSPGGGAGMYNFKSSPLLTGCTFSDNDGIGMLNFDNSCPTVIDCAFVGNNSSGARNVDNSNSQFVRCLFRDNQYIFGFGGGMYNSDSSPTLTFCTFSGNHAYGSGGFLNRSGDPTLIGCSFRGNTSSSGLGGGAFRNINGDPTLINCIFSGNKAVRGDYEVCGGGMLNWRGNATLINCTFSNNYCEGSSGGIYNRYGNVILVNCVLWGNSDTGGMDQSAQIDGSQPSTVDYSCIQGWTGNLGGQGNVAEDPLLVDADGADDIVGTEDDNLRLSFGSPCIDTGDNTAVPPAVLNDFDGNQRVLDGDDDGIPVVDMGAYEMVTKIEVAMRFTPRVLNCNSKGRWVKAHFILPAGITVEDVDYNISGRIEPLGIESDHMDVFADEDGLVRVEMAFDRAAFCDGLTGCASIEITVKGFLTNGYYFYGKDTVKIIRNIFEHLAFLSSQWLRTECSKPDWCQGADIDQDSVVNLYDYTIMAERWMEKE